MTKLYTGVAAGWLMTILLPAPILNTICNRGRQQ
ncbi:hypothetical protein C8K36_102478 [Rhodococcus sp. OK519]|nr:hypothetical protein C8K36_102478 [Rhodococcus sp. OK519]